jgi:hypothetical protein
MRQFAGMLVALGALLQVARRSEWYFFSSFPKIYRSCITIVSRKTDLSSQSGLTMKDAGCVAKTQRGIKRTELQRPSVAFR